MPSIHLTPAERQDLLAHDRRSADPEVRLRSHILLLLDAGHPWATVGAVLFCSASTISRWKPTYTAKGPGNDLASPLCGRYSGTNTARLRRLVSFLISFHIGNKAPDACVKSAGSRGLVRACYV